MKPRLSQPIAILLACTLLAPPVPAQPRSPASDLVRTRVLKFGVGQLVHVREQSGVELNGEITGIGPQVFQMQRRDAAGPTFVYYADVVQLRRARASSRQAASPTSHSPAGAAIGALIVVGFIGLLYAVCGGSSPCLQSNRNSQPTH